MRKLITHKRTPYRADEDTPPLWLLNTIPRAGLPIKFGFRSYVVNAVGKDITASDSLKIEKTLRKRGFKVSMRRYDFSARIEAPNDWVVVVDYLLQNYKLYRNPNGGGLQC